MKDTPREQPDSAATLEDGPRRSTSRRALLKRGSVILAGAAGLSAAGAAIAPPASASGDPSAPTGSAGGDLTGTYPNPTIASAVLTDNMFQQGAGIPESRVSLAADAAWGTASLRTIGDGEYQATPGHLPVITSYGYHGSAYQTSSVSFVAVDSTNLAITFIAPDTGAVFVTLNAPVLTSSTSEYVAWGLLNGAMVVNYGYVTNLNYWNRQTLQLKVTGLTAGSSYTYDWAWKVYVGSPSYAQIAAAAPFGYVSMIVERCLA